MIFGKMMLRWCNECFSHLSFVFLTPAKRWSSENPLESIYVCENIYLSLFCLHMYFPIQFSIFLFLSGAVSVPSLVLWVERESGGERVLVREEQQIRVRLCCPGAHRKAPWGKLERGCHSGSSVLF